MIPNGAIGARFSADGRALYLTDVTGLAISDVSNPDSPQIRSHLPLPRCGGSGLTPQARATGWPDHGASVGFYVSAGTSWGAYLAPSDCPTLGSRGRAAERVTLSPIGELGRSASWGRGPAPSPPALA